jgi:hypothetical protein
MFINGGAQAERDREGDGGGQVAAADDAVTTK